MVEPRPAAPMAHAWGRREPNERLCCLEAESPSTRRRRHEVTGLQTDVSSLILCPVVLSQLVIPNHSTVKLPNDGPRLLATLGAHMAGTHVQINTLAADRAHAILCLVAHTPHAQAASSSEQVRASSWADAVRQLPHTPHYRLIEQAARGEGGAPDSCPWDLSSWQPSDTPCPTPLEMIRNACLHVIEQMDGMAMPSRCEVPGTIVGCGRGSNR